MKRKKVFAWGNFFAEFQSSEAGAGSAAGKESGTMKIRKTILSAVFLLGAMGPSISSAAAAASVVSKDAFTEGSYCHMKFPGDS
jgi:hypothetical protein